MDLVDANADGHSVVNADADANAEAEIRDAIHIRWVHINANPDRAWWWHLQFNENPEPEVTMKEAMAPGPEDTNGTEAEDDYLVNMIE